MNRKITIPVSFLMIGDSKNMSPFMVMLGPEPVITNPVKYS